MNLQTIRSPYVSESLEDAPRLLLREEPCDQGEVTLCCTADNILEKSSCEYLFH